MQRSPVSFKKTKLITKGGNFRNSRLSKTSLYRVSIILSSAMDACILSKNQIDHKRKDEFPKLSSWKHPSHQVSMTLFERSGLLYSLKQAKLITKERPNFQSLSFSKTLLRRISIILSDATVVKVLSRGLERVRIFKIPACENATMSFRWKSYRTQWSSFRPWENHYTNQEGASFQKNLGPINAFLAKTYRFLEWSRFLNFMFLKTSPCMIGKVISICKRLSVIP